jgi:hypothetical protein
VLARSSLVDEERKRKRYLRFLDRFFQWTQPAPASDDSEADARLLASLETHLNALPVEDREIIEREYFSGQSVREIASEIGDPELLSLVAGRPVALVRPPGQPAELIFLDPADQPGFLAP